MSPDISMCQGTGCPIRETCYRFKAKPSPYRQSYFMTPPWDGKQCDAHWPVVSKSQVKRLDVQTKGEK